MSVAIGIERERERKKGGGPPRGRTLHCGPERSFVAHARYVRILWCRCITTIIRSRWMSSGYALLITTGVIAC